VNEGGTKRLIRGGNLKGAGGDCNPKRKRPWGHPRTKDRSRRKKKRRGEEKAFFGRGGGRGKFIIVQQVRLFGEREHGGSYRVVSTKKEWDPGWTERFRVNACKR